MGLTLYVKTKNGPAHVTKNTLVESMQTSKKQKL